MQIKIPTECPCCNSTLEMVNDQLFCRNSACSAQLNKRLEHFCKVLGIKGIGPKTVEKLNIQDLTEIFYLDSDALLTSLNSKKTADKLLLEIEQAKQADLATVLASFSIPLIGNTAAKKIAMVVDNVTQIDSETCRQAGLGEKATANLLNFLETDFQEMKPFLPFSFNSEKTSSANNTSPTVCITGKLKSYKTKAEAAAALQAADYVVVETITKTTNYLVDEENKGSSKRKKAETLGIQIIDNLNNFLKEIND